MTCWKIASITALLVFSLPLNAAPPPGGERQLCRTLERSLDDGKTLGIQRCWSIRFAPDGSMTRIDGSQSSVSVAAPAALAELARLEEKRIENGIFPLVLGPDGLVEDRGGMTAGETLGDASEAASVMIAQIEPNPAAADAMREFVAQVASASAHYLGRVPRDLFYPVAANNPQIIAVALPDGSTGRVTLNQSSVTDPVSGLLISARRSIVTEAGGTTTQSVETWALSPPD